MPRITVNLTNKWVKLNFTNPSYEIDFYVIPYIFDVFIEQKEDKL